jgi:hypothetical protein
MVHIIPQDKTDNCHVIVSIMLEKILKEWHERCMWICKIYRSVILMMAGNITLK